MNDRRREPRNPAHISVRIWGQDSRGHQFAQEATARNFSLGGALLIGLEHRVRCGDLIGVQCGERKARFRVVWVRKAADSSHHAALHLAENQECPWKEWVSQRGLAEAARA
jgi:hypothetical protein